MSWRQKLKQRLCRHRYSDANLTSCSVTGGIRLKNYCIKCGKPYEVRMSDRYIDNIIEQDMEEMRKYGHLTGK